MLPAATLSRISTGSAGAFALTLQIDAMILMTRSFEIRYHFKMPPLHQDAAITTRRTVVFFFFFATDGFIHRFSVPRATTDRYRRRCRSRIDIRALDGRCFAFAPPASEARGYYARCCYLSDGRAGRAENASRPAQNSPLCA